MNTLSLLTTHKTSSGAVHTQVLLNDKDVGLLYLTDKEKQLLIDILRRGLVGSDTKLQTDFFEEIEEEESPWWDGENDNI